MGTTSTRCKKTLRALFVTLAALIALGELTSTAPLLLGGGEARAVIGRPLTPGSYAGVARRTARRTTRRTVAATATVAAPAVYTTLPAGCMKMSSGGTVYYQCGTARYRAYYNGGTLVYSPM